MKKTVKYIPMYALAFLISMIGVVWQMLAPNKAAMVVLVILALLPLFLLVGSMHLSNRYLKKIREAKVADMRGYMLRHRQEAEQTSEKLLQKLQKRRHIATAYAVVIWLLGACAAILGGMLYATSIFVFFLFVFYAGTIFLAVHSRIQKKQPLELDEKAVILTQEEFPLIYDTVARAAKALDCRREFTIVLLPDCNAGITFDGNRYYLQLGAILLSIFTQEELYCTCLHEFSHCAEKNLPIKREVEYGNWLASSKNVPLPVFAASQLFTYLDVLYLFDHMTYEYATSVVKETEADRDMVRHGNPMAAATSLLKLDYDSKFVWESGVRNETPALEPEEPDPHYLRARVEKLKEAIRERHEDWDAMIEKEILPNNATHPTLKMRLETLGVEDVDAIEYPRDSAYADEIQKVLDFADKKLIELHDTYEQDRREQYLEPLERITKWKESGEPIAAETYADIIADLHRLGRYEDAERLCERVIEELDEYSSYHAYFIKGCAMLYRYEEAGVDLIYHALEGNQNYLENGLNVIGEFFCMTGREQELLDYRARAAQLSQQDKDEFSQTSFLSKNDKLSRDEMPKEMLEEILGYIRSVDCDIIQKIYLVRKTVSETYFASAFVIHFYGGTDAQREDIMHKIFRYLDTYPVDWHFALFDYFDYPDIKFDKIEGSLVYSKNNNKGEKK